LISASVATIYIIVTFGFVIFWIVNYRQGLTDSPQTDYPFNYHPISMSLAYIVFMGQALIVWREDGWVIKTPGRLIRKGLHAVCNGLALLFATLGLVAVFDYHNINKIPNMYSLHSWVGISTVVLSFLLWVVSFTIFVFPGAPEKYRELFVGYHRFCGVMIFGGAIISCVSGILEKQTFIISAAAAVKVDAKWAEGSMIANVTGMLFIATAIAVYFQLFTRHSTSEHVALIQKE